MWLAVDSSLKAFNTVQGSGIPNLRTAAGVFNVLKKTHCWPFSFIRHLQYQKTKKRMRTRHVPLAKTAFAVDSSVAFFW